MRRFLINNREVKHDMTFTANDKITNGKNETSAVSLKLCVQ